MQGASYEDTVARREEDALIRLIDCIDEPPWFAPIRSATLDRTSLYFPPRFRRVKRSRSLFSAVTSSIHPQRYSSSKACRAIDCRQTMQVRTAHRQRR